MNLGIKQDSSTEEDPDPEDSQESEPTIQTPYYTISLEAKKKIPQFFSPVTRLEEIKK